MDIKEYHAAFNAIWKLFRHYYELLPMTDAQWSELVDRMERISDQAPATMITKMLVAMCNELEMLDKLKKEAA